MKYNGVVFDLDGTLLNSLADIADSVNAALAAAHLPVHSLEAYLYFVGDGLDTLIQRVIPPKLPHAASVCDTLMEAVRREYGHRWSNKSQPYPGINAMLSGFSARQVSMAVLSNKPHSFTVTIVKHFFPSIPFRVVYGVSEQVPKKPDPAGALMIAQQLRLHPREIIFAGDTNTDMYTARAAGMVPVGVTWGFRPEAELQSAGAQYIAHCPQDIVRLTE